MQFYVISPLSDLSLMEKGDRIFVLAQLWIKSEKYRQFIIEQKNKGKWITLDNGAGDYDTTITLTQLIEITKQLLPNEVIALDKLYDKQTTIYNYQLFERMMIDNDLADKVEIFGCPQGKDLDDWLDCYQFMLEQPLIKTIGLSKITVPYVFNNEDNEPFMKTDKRIMEGRHLCYDFLKKNDLIHKPIHCLGAGDPREFIKYLNDDMMRSTDSCFTVWSAMNNIDWLKGNFERIATPHDYFDRIVEKDKYQIIDNNINFLKQVLNR